MRRLHFLVVVLMLGALILQGAAQKKMPKPGWNLFSKDQDIQMGREYAAQVERQMHVVPNKELTDYVNRVGMRLVRQGKLDDYPYYFKVVQDDSINAFALPGGPMYIHTGLLKAVENEAQLAGVLAHELSHVVLRHGTHQATKAEALQLGAMLLGGAAARGGGLTGMLAQLGIGLAGNSVLLSFSRSMESEADLLGARTMAMAGYNPIELARFFEKLESQGGTRNSLLTRFLSDHPSPENRVQAIEDQLPYLPRGPYNAQEGELARVRALVAQLPAAPKKGNVRDTPPAGQSPYGQGSAAMPSLSLSGRYTMYQGGGVAFSYPEGWTPHSGSDGSVTLAPAEGLAGGGIGAGILLTILPARNGRVDLASDSKRYLESITQGNPNVRVEQQAQRTTVARCNALMTRLTSDSPFAGQRETDVVLTVDRGDALIAFVFISPSAQYANLDPAFQRVMQTLQFQQ